MLDTWKGYIRSVTELGVALLALAIVASLLVGPTNMAFLGDVVGNITALVSHCRRWVSSSRRASSAALRSVNAERNATPDATMNAALHHLSSWLTT